jgi:methanethiol S-methyltransferase
LVCYTISFVTLLYTVGFVGNFAVPRSIDAAPTIAWYNALLVDVALLGVFSIQHSVMARQGFKHWWIQFVLQPIERSTYILFTSLCLIALFYFWQPIGGSIWNVTNPTGIAILYILGSPAYMGQMG